ncbi:hypothetical protein YC2023_039155 [Brassica napus]
MYLRGRGEEFGRNERGSLAGGSFGCQPPPPVSRIMLQPYITAIQKRRPLLLVSGILEFCLCKPNRKSGDYLSSL